MDEEVVTAPLDRKLADMLRDGRLADIPPWHTMSVAEARRLEDEVFSAGGGPSVESAEDRRIDGPAGEISIRLYRPEVPDASESEVLPGLVFCHGGGWVLGTLDSADDICRHLAARVGSVVVSVDYRLAPDHPFPAPVDDTWAAVEWVRANAQSLAVAPDRIGVAGTSSGGGLAAAIGLRARETNWSPAVQVLCYPVLDCDFDTPSYREYADASLLSRADMRWFWDQYLDGVDAGDEPLAAPLRAESLAGCPPTVIATAGHDVLRSEGVAFAERLHEDGVPTTHLHYPSLAHGFLSVSGDVGAADEAMKEVANSVRVLF